MTLFEEGGAPPPPRPLEVAPRTAGGSSRAVVRQLLSGCGLRSALLIGLGFVLGHLWQASKPPLGCRSQFPEKRNLFLQKVTFGFETKEKEQFIAHPMTEREAIDQMRNREGETETEDRDTNKETEREERGRKGGGRRSNSSFSSKQHFKEIQRAKKKKKLLLCRSLIRKFTLWPLAILGTLHLLKCPLASETGQGDD